METNNQTVAHRPTAADRVLAGMRRLYVLKRELDDATRELEHAVADVQRSCEVAHD